jgi:hypothetical protein
MIVIGVEGERDWRLIAVVRARTPAPRMVMGWEGEVDMVLSVVD